MGKSVEAEKISVISTFTSNHEVHPSEPYDFSNWQLFKSDTLLYHSIKFPDSDDATDRIATFRSLMSPRVVDYLETKRHDIFVAEHKDWAEWLDDVTQLLGDKDKTIDDTLVYGLPYENALSCIKGLVGDCTTSANKLWTNLNELADRDVISHYQHVQAFWEALSPRRQVKLADRCAYFDPSDHVWNASHTDRMLAKRMLNFYMLIRVDLIDRAQRRRLILLSLTTLSLVTLALFTFAASALVRVFDSRNLRLFIPLIVLGVFFIFLAICVARPLRSSAWTWRQQRELTKVFRDGIDTKQ